MEIQWKKNRKGWYSVNRVYRSRKGLVPRYTIRKNRSAYCMIATYSDIEHGYVPISLYDRLEAGRGSGVYYSVDDAKKAFDLGGL